MCVQYKKKNFFSLYQTHYVLCSGNYNSTIFNQRGILVTPLDVDTLLQNNSPIEIVLIPELGMIGWMEQKVEEEILLHYQRNLRLFVNSPDVPMILLKVGLPTKLEEAVKQLNQVKKSAQLELILKTLLDDEKIDQDYITNIRKIKTEEKITEEARLILDMIAVGQLQKFLMHIKNQILLQQREEDKANYKKKQQKSNLQMQILGIKDTLKKKYNSREKNKPSNTAFDNIQVENPQTQQQEVQFSDLPNIESTRILPESEISEDLTENNEFNCINTQNTQNEYHTANEGVTSKHTRLQPIRTPKFDDSDVESSLVQLELLANQLPQSQHPQLIITFLAASSKLELLGGASEQQRTDVKEFTKMIREELGLSSKAQLSRKLNNIMQEHGETFLELKTRIENTYKRLHEKQKLSSADEHILVEIFISALKNEKIKNQLQLDDVNFQNVLKRANLVKQIVESTKTPSHEDSHLLESIYQMMIQQKKCDNCGNNHETSDCLASPKLLSKWRKVTGTSKDMKYNDFSQKRKNDQQVQFKEQNQQNESKSEIQYQNSGSNNSNRSNYQTQSFQDGRSVNQQENPGRNNNYNNNQMNNNRFTQSNQQGNKGQNSYFDKNRFDNSRFNQTNQHRPQNQLWRNNSQFQNRNINQNYNPRKNNFQQNVSPQYTPRFHVSQFQSNQGNNYRNQTNNNNNQQQNYPTPMRQNNESRNLPFVHPTWRQKEQNSMNQINHLITKETTDSENEEDQEKDLLEFQDSSD